MKGTLSLLEKLLCPPSEDHRGRLSAGAVLEEVKPLTAQLDLLEFPARAQHVCRHSVHCCLHLCACRSGCPPHVGVLHAACAEDVPVCKVLRCKVPYRQFGQDDLSPRLHHQVQLLVDDLPLCVHDRLVLLGLLDAHLCVFLLCLEFELHVQEKNFGVLEFLRLLLEACIGEGLLEGHPRNQHGVEHRPSGDLFDTDHVSLKLVSEKVHGLYNHVGEELLVARHELRVQSRFCTPSEQLGLFLVSRSLEVDCQVTQLPLCEVFSFSVPPHNDLGVQTVLNKPTSLTKKLSGNDHHRSSAISHFTILGLGDVHHDLCSGVHDLEELHHCGSVICDGDILTFVDQFVHPTGAQSGLHDVDHNLAGIDVRKNVCLALGCVCALLKEDNIRLHHMRHLAFCLYATWRKRKVGWKKGEEEGNQPAALFFLK
mmetsp:Transcript_21585/g.42908  ORF Transcript_21585/g.42908 Transcript_21585/m.42908 type:complete len:426 (+) Transcript_21585:449-1726(+)